MVSVRFSFKKVAVLSLFVFFGALAVLGYRAFAAEENKLTIAFGYARPPYLFHVGDEVRGFEYEIVKEALALEGYQVVPSFLRLSNEELRGAFRENLDAIATVRYDTEGPGYLSDSFIEFQNFAMTRANSGIKIRNLKDLLGHRVGAWQLAHIDLGKDFNSIAVKLHKQGTYFEYPNQKDQVVDFLDGNTDVLVIDKDIYNYYAYQMHSVADVVFHPIFGESTRYYVRFKHAEHRDAFNRGLKKLRRSGRYDEIVGSYAIIGTGK